MNGTRRYLPKTLGLAALLLAAPALAHEPNFCGQARAHPVDAAFDAATAAAGGVTYDMKEAIGVALIGWDAELNRLYRALLPRLPAQSAKQLRDAQRAWLAWDRQQARADAALLATGGSGDALQAMDLQRLRLRSRVCDLQGWLDMEAEAGAD